MKLNPIRANMTEVEIGRLRILVSYKTPVAYLDLSTKKYYQTEKKWSRTTARHINQWLAGFHSEKIPQAALDSIAEG